MLKLNFNKTRKLLVGVFFFLLLINVNQINAADKIKTFDIQMDVQENGLIKVKQKVSINFETQKHGMYASIPEKYTMNWDGVIKSYNFPVKKIKVEKHDYQVMSERYGKVIKIGNKNIYVNGLVNYEYSYDIQTRDLKLNGKQMLYFNLVGKEWNFDMEKVNFKINMPKSFKQTPSFYLKNNDKVNYSINDKTITGSYNNLNQFNPLTIQLNLDNDYFIYEDTSYQQIYINIVAVFTSLIAIILFFRYGKDKQLIPSVQFNAPSGYSSAQVGYVYDGSLSQKDITSLLVYWASKGYMCIKEINETKFEFSKLKDIDVTELNLEQNLFNALFSVSDVVESDNIPESFSTTQLSMKISYSDYFAKDKLIFSKKSRLYQVIFGLINSLILSSFVALSVYNYSYDGIYAGISALICASLSITLSVFITYTLKAIINKRSFKTIGFAFLTIVALTAFMIGYIFINTYLGISLLNILIILVTYIFMSIIVCFMDKRTDYGHDKLEEITGFKNFMEVAEKEKLEMLVLENPAFFYDLLPYAYVLDVSDKWIKKFENIKMPQPTWYYSSSPYMNYYFLYHLNSTMYAANISAISSATQGSGGFSSGGGGFSGGGFGGGGGGSW